MGNDNASFVKSFYENLLIKEKVVFPIGSISIPIGFAAKGEILTAKNVRKRKASVSWYFMRKEAGEDINHLLLHCHFCIDFMVENT